MKKESDSVIEIQIENTTKELKQVSLFCGFAIMGEKKYFTDSGDYVRDGVKISVDGLSYRNIVFDSMNKPLRVIFTTPIFPVKRNKKLDKPCQVWNRDPNSGIPTVLPLVGVYDPYADQSVIANHYWIDGLSEFKIFNVPKKSIVTIQFIIENR